MVEFGSVRCVSTAYTKPFLYMYMNMIANNNAHSRSEILYKSPSECYNLHSMVAVIFIYT